MNRLFAGFFFVLCLGYSARGAITTEFYQINSCNYVVIGGFAGVITRELPIETQHFVVLSIDHDTGSAEMRILGDDASTVFRHFVNGTLEGGVVRFSYTIPYPGFGSRVRAELDYSVQLGNASIWINGSNLIDQMLRCNTDFESKDNKTGHDQYE